MMTPAQLLQECETLSYMLRIRRMVELGRQAGSDASIRETLGALAQGDAYQRCLAVHACHGSRDAAQALRALSDPSRSVRGLALTLAPMLCSDAEILAILDTLPPDLKIALISLLSKKRRQALLDAYIGMLAAHHDDELRHLLPFGSRDVVAHHLEHLHERLDLLCWKRLARRHPDLVLAQLLRLARSTPTSDPLLLLRANTVLPFFAHHTPDFAFELVRGLMVSIPFQRLELQPLVQRRPDEMVDLLVQAGERNPHLDFTRVAHRLTMDHLLTLFTRYSDAISTSCLKKVRPEQRLTFYIACARAWRNDEGILGQQIVAALPAEPRLQEARRHLELPILLTRPQERFPYAAFLSWDEARALLDAPLRSPDADLRKVALQTLIAATRYQRSYLSHALQLVKQRRNEQDPVRGAMLVALMHLPHGTWRAEHLDDLSQIIHDALEATDLSHASLFALQHLVVQLFPFHAAWAAQQMALIYSKRGYSGYARLDSYLSDKDIAGLALVLMPILKAWQNREQENLLVIVATLLGRRLRVFNEFADLLETTLERTLSAGIAISILNLFLAHQRERIPLLIPRLLNKDKSTITLSPVSIYLHRSRQDLLTPFLGQRAYRGRFSTGHTRFVPPLYAGFQRWTPQQQDIYAQTLLQVAKGKNQHRAAYELISTIQRLAALTWIEPTYLLQFAHDERPLVREAALRVLGDLDAGQGIPVLLEALNDERARIAIYALRSALLVMPKIEVLNYLRSAPLTQVTVAKEVIRLIGDLSTEVAYRELLALETRDLHRDVYVALLRALWNYAEQPEAWNVFEKAAQNPDSAIARGVVHIPEDGLSPDALQRLTMLTATLLGHPEHEVRVATLQWRSQHPLADYEHVLLNRLLSLLHTSSPGECENAANAIFTIYTGHEASLVGQAVRDLLRQRRSLQTVLQNFAAMLRYNRQVLLPTTRALLDVLSEDRLTISWRVTLSVAGLPWPEVTLALTRLANELHADALQRAEQVVHEAVSHPNADLLELETTLAQSDDERLRRLALAALVAQGQASGWSDERIARLHVYQQDTSALVAEAAQFTFPA